MAPIRFNDPFSDRYGYDYPDAYDFNFPSAGRGPRLDSIIDGRISPHDRRSSRDANFAREDARHRSAYPDGSAYGRRPSILHLDPSVDRSRTAATSSSRRPSYNQFTMQPGSLSRSGATRRGDNERYRSPRADLGTLGGDVYDRFESRGYGTSSYARDIYGSSSYPRDDYGSGSRRHGSSRDYAHDLHRQYGLSGYGGERRNAMSGHSGGYYGGTSSGYSSGYGEQGTRSSYDRYDDRSYYRYH